jgi:hypothetical protein
VNREASLTSGEASSANGRGSESFLNCIAKLELGNEDKWR